MKQGDEVVTEVLVLTQKQYAALERDCPVPVLTSNPDSAAYNLGIQFVLSKLRNGFVGG